MSFLFFCLVLATQSGCLHAALNARHTGCCALEHQRTIDTWRHWRPRSLQVSSRSLLLRVQIVLTFLCCLFRDPRQRRLAEKQQQQQQQRAGDAVPEKLSFKEKMKMFALESGEDNTPKDKLKISRAQRDIDAVH